MSNIQRLLLINALFVLTILPPRCASWGLEIHDCSLGLEAIDDVIDAAAEKWPEVHDISQRLDIICLPPGIRGIANYNNCQQDVLACSRRPGSDTMRAIILVANDVPVDIVLGHELLHLVAMQRGVVGGCYRHKPECWDWNAVEELQQLAMDVGDCVRGECVCVAEDGSKDFATECASP